MARYMESEVPHRLCSLVKLAIATLWLDWHWLFRLWHSWLPPAVSLTLWPWSNSFDSIAASAKPVLASASPSRLSSADSCWPHNVCLHRLASIQIWGTPGTLLTSSAQLRWSSCPWCPWTLAKACVDYSAGIQSDKAGWSWSCLWRLAGCYHLSCCHFGPLHSQAGGGLSYLAPWVHCWWACVSSLYW